jgi:hypothetical protein
VTEPSDRELLGIVYCRTCKQDTCSFDLAGRCLWCGELPKKRPSAVKKEAA